MLAKLSKNAGAKIVIHDPALPAIPDEYGIDMQPNTARDQFYNTFYVRNLRIFVKLECLSMVSLSTLVFYLEVRLVGSLPCPQTLD
jgi:hypothetical protein